VIEEVTIKNFKCFRELSLSDLGRITLIGGRNNVGKTALLEALFMFFDRLQPNTVLRQYAWRGIEFVSPLPDTMWAPIFRNLDLAQEISVGVKIDGRYETARYKFNPKFSLPKIQGPVPDKPTEQQIRTDAEPVTSFALSVEYERGDGPKDKGHIFVSPEGGLGLHAERLHFRGRPYVFLPSMRHLATRETADLFSNLAKRGEEDKVAAILQLIEPNLVGLKTITQGPSTSVHAQVKGLPVTLPVALMGEGASKLLNIIVGIGNSRGGIVLVDEIENGIHHSVMQSIWQSIGKAVRDYDCQLLATTHSYECLQAAYEGLKDVADDFRYLRLDRKEDNTVGKVATHEIVGQAIAANMEVR
jgi:predicted ATPase